MMQKKHEQKLYIDDVTNKHISITWYAPFYQSLRKTALSPPTQKSQNSLTMPFRTQTH